MALPKPTKLPTPSNWASPIPFGLGEQKPNNYKEVFRAIRENSDNAGYAWRILNEGVCDGCALGTKGLADWTISGVHLCNVRLRLLRLNTMGAFADDTLDDAEALRGLRGDQLRRLGRLPHPMLREHGETGFKRIGWSKALDLVAGQIRESGPDRAGFFLTSRGMANENYYAAQKAARAIGTNSVDNAARICHSPSTFALKGALGVAATTCSYSDWIGTDLIVFIGSNVANNQPVATKYLHVAKKAGTKIATVGPYREPGMERYWVPSKAESAVFGTQISDRFFQITTGGDIGFLTGVLKHMLEAGLTNEGFIAERTSGFEALRETVAAAPWEELERLAGTSREEMVALGEMLGAAERGVLVWSMGVTQHGRGEDGVRAIVNLGLARGWIGREGCGLMPIRGHSGVQGGAEMGCYATAFPGGREINAETAAELGEEWGFEVPSTVGRTAPEMIDAARAGELDLLFAVGGNFVDVLPDPDEVAATLGRIPLRVHMDITLSSQMLVPPAEGGRVLLLPATTRYEVPGGVTETSTERRVILSPEIEGPRIGEARPEWQVFGDLAERVRPDLARCGPVRGHCRDPRRDRPCGAPATNRSPSCVKAATRSSTAVHGFARGSASRRPTGLPISPISRCRSRHPTMAVRALDPARQAVQLDGPGARRRAERGRPGGGPDQRGRRRAAWAGRRCRCALRNEHGELDAQLCVAPIAPGNLQVHWPEGNVLIGPERSPESGIPDYNARVSRRPTASRR